jgi:hypothetical protein
MTEVKWSHLYWAIIRDCVARTLASKDPKVDDVRLILKQIIKDIDNIAGDTAHEFYGRGEE